MVLIARYISAVFWTDYKQITQQSKNLYSAELNPLLLIDLALNKWLWNKQIKLDFVFRNILNQDDLSHPIGATLNLRFYLQAAIMLNFFK
jgi:hypothetical protein